MPIYASDADRQPDSDFEPGRLWHLAAGARGRLLDPRRTPVSVVRVRQAVGFVDMRIEGFEDTGAIWEVPLEEVDHYQFEPDGPRAGGAAVAEMESAVRRFARTQVVMADEEARTRTEAGVNDAHTEADAWLAAHSRFLADGRALPDPATRRSDPLLTADLEAWFRERALWDIEAAFTRQYVSNPGSGELVKGHRIVLAELGLTRYQGPVVRDPATFAGDRTKARRAEHIVARLAFVRALFAHLGIRSVSLWRGLSTDTRLRDPDSGRSFVSTSFDEAVARAHYDSATGIGATRVITQQAVPVERLFMTYLETAAMNDHFLEAEAVVLAQPGDRWP